jgi:hypothetical protein
VGLGFQVHYPFTRTISSEKGSCGPTRGEDTWFSNVKFKKKDVRKIWNCNTPQNLQNFSGDSEIALIDFNSPLSQPEDQRMYCLQ